MMHTPHPVMAMPSATSYLRAVSETCTDSLDARDGARSVTLDAIPLPDGTEATVRCSRSRRTNALHVSISFRRPRLSALPADTRGLEPDR